MNQQFASIAEQSGFLNLVVCHNSMFSSPRQVTSRIITVFVVVEQRRISDLSYEQLLQVELLVQMQDKKKRTPSDALCSNPQLVFLEVFGSLSPALTNFIQEIYFCICNFIYIYLETCYDVKKVFIVDTRTANTIL